MVDKLGQTNHISIVRFTNLKLSLGILCLVAVVLVPAQMAHARGFMLKVNLFDGKVDSGKVTVFVLSEATDKKKSKSLDIGRIASKTGDSTIERLAFRFTDIQLPPNGAFSACVYSKNYGTTQCEQADRHHDASSAIMWVQVPR
jgi:hypothetical protein